MLYLHYAYSEFLPHNFPEPILSDGGDHIRIHDDGWTALSADDSRSAQFEHTILITDHGVDILTS